jgi:hypothetical protein
MGGGIMIENIKIDYHSIQRNKVSRTFEVNSFDVYFTYKGKNKMGLFIKSIFADEWKLFDVQLSVGEHELNEIERKLLEDEKVRSITESIHQII